MRLLVSVALLLFIAAASGHGAPDRGCSRIAHRGTSSYLLCFSPGQGHGTFFVEQNGVRRQLPVKLPGPTPTARDAGRVGHWAWAALSPDGKTLLAQWSGDCETPVAFFAPVAGGGVRVATGEADWAQSPVSVAYGWTTDGRAIVGEPESTACGRNGAGLYLIDPMGRRTLVRHASAHPRRSETARPASALVAPRLQ